MTSMKVGIAAALIAAASIAYPSMADSYVTATVGANFDDTGTFIESDTGTIVGLAVGMPIKAVPGLRGELELSQRSNDVEVLGGFIDAQHNTTSVMANLAYDINADIGPARPYVLVGAGYARTEGVIENLSLATLESSGFAWQIGGGLRAKVAEGITADIGYRYFSGPEIEVLGFEVSDGSNHSITAGLSFSF